MVSHCFNSQDLHNCLQYSSHSLPPKCTDCHQNKEFMDHHVHIHHRSLDANPRLAINLLHGIFCSSELCKCQPAEEIRLAVSVLHICAAEDECEWDRVDLCDSTCARVLSGSGFVLSLRAGEPDYWSASLWLRHRPSDRISCICVSARICY